MVDPMIAIKIGDLMGGIIDVYTNVLGNWTFGIAVFIIIGAIYLKTQKVTMPVIIALFFGVTMVAIIPENTIGWLFIILGMATIGMKALFGRGS